jgi:hypothetical protein
MRINIKISTNTYIYTLILISLLFFRFRENEIYTNTSTGVFTYVVNDKVFTMENVKAYMRNTTGGRKQLSLSNDRFVKFFFINPETKKIDLSTNEAKNAIIRYNEPGTNYIYHPRNGFVNIESIDNSNKILSGEFEMEMVLEGKDKVIRITKGKLINIPIVFIR